MFGQAASLGQAHLGDELGARLVSKVERVCFNKRVLSSVQIDSCEQYRSMVHNYSHLKQKVGWTNFLFNLFKGLKKNQNVLILENNKEKKKNPSIAKYSSSNVDIF